MSWSFTVLRRESFTNDPSLWPVALFHFDCFDTRKMPRAADGCASTPTCRPTVSSCLPTTFIDDSFCYGGKNIWRAEFLCDWWIGPTSVDTWVWSRGTMISSLGKPKNSRKLLHYHFVYHEINSVMSCKMCLSGADLRLKCRVASVCTPESRTVLSANDLLVQKQW